MTDALRELLDAVRALQGEKSERQYAHWLGVNRQVYRNVMAGTTPPSRHFLSRLVQKHGNLYPLVMRVLETEKAEKMSDEKAVSVVEAWGKLGPVVDGTGCQRPSGNGF